MTSDNGDGDGDGGGVVVEKDDGDGDDNGGGVVVAKGGDGDGDKKGGRRRRHRPRRRRRWVKALLWGWASFAVLLLALWFGVYIWVGGRFDDILSGAISRAEFAGHRVVYRGLTRGGFPRSVLRVYRGLEIRFTNGLYLESAALAAEYFMADPRRAELRGEKILLRSAGGGDFGAFELGGEAVSLLLRRELTGEARGVSLRSEGVRFRRVDGLGATFAEMAADLDVAAADADHTLDFSFSFGGGEGLASDDGDGDGAGASAWLGDFLLEGRFFGDLLGSYDRYGILYWRDSGGYVEMDVLRFGSGAALIEADGSLALDGEARPLGSGRFIFSGGEELLEELGMSREMALLLGGGEGGELLRLELSWRAQDGTLFVGGFPVYEFDPLF